MRPLTRSGTSEAPLDPHLSPVDFHGRPTQNHLPETTSPVIDAGSGCFDIDQRGRLRPRDGKGDDVIHCDIGAVEWEPRSAEG